MNKSSRSSRIKNWSLGDCIFVPEPETEDYIPPEIALANISESGVGLWIQDTRVYLPPGLHLKGELRTPGQTFKVELKVVRQSQYIYGCHFTREIPGLTEYLNANYYIENTANQMISVGENYLAPRPEGTPHWHSDGMSELYYIDNDEMVVYYRINYQANNLERVFDPSTHFKFLGESTGFYHSEYTEITRFINHINELPPSVRKQIIDDIETIQENI